MIPQLLTMSRTSGAMQTSAWVRGSCRPNVHGLGAHCNSGTMPFLLSAPTPSGNALRSQVTTLERATLPVTCQATSGMRQGRTSMDLQSLKSALTSLRACACGATSASSRTTWRPSCSSIARRRVRGLAAEHSHRLMLSVSFAVDVLE